MPHDVTKHLCNKVYIHVLLNEMTPQAHPPSVLDEITFQEQPDIMPESDMSLPLG